MKVAILKSRAQNRGGLEKMASRIASGFAERGSSVSILTTEGTHDFCGTFQIQPIKTRRWPAWSRIEDFDAGVSRWLAEHPHEIVFGMDRNRFQTHFRAGNGVHDAYLKSRIAAEGRLKYFTCLLNPMHRKILEIERTAFESPTLKKLITNSEMVRRQILERYAISPSKIAVIHNGVEWSEMQADFDAWPEKKPLHCKALGLDPNCFHLLFIGNGYLRKGLFQLLEGIARLSRKDLFLSVVGKESRQERYAAKAAELKLSSQIRFFGAQADMRPFYQVADALAIPSFYDPFANVTVEALAMGLFVLSSTSNGGAEILSPETGAVIEDLLSPDAMAAALQIALSHPKTASSAALRRNWVERLDYKRQMNALIEVCID